jgi:hypothetical protein
MRARWVTLLVVMVCAALAVLVAVPAASANVGAPTQGGQLAGEPAGIRDIAIAHEDLAIDLRPLVDGNLAQVSATYHLDNRAADQTLDLVLASGSGEPVQFRVTLDGAEVPTAAWPDAALPASWQAPTATPRLDGDGELGYELRHPGGPLGFRLAVPPGRHTLSLAYSADPVHHHAGEPMLLHQFVYVLSPARTWAGFGGLDVTLRVPPGWRAAVRPALVRDGDTLHAAFPDLPADAIAVTVAAPAGAFRIIRYTAGALFAIVALCGGIAVARVAAARERHALAAGKLPSPWVALGAGFAWSAAFLAAGLCAVLGPAEALPAAQVDHRGYGEAFAAILVVIGALFVLPIGVWVARAAGRRESIRVLPTISGGA